MRISLKVLIITAIIMKLSFIAIAAEPVLFFSDITSGPKFGLGDGLGNGAIVTVWGSSLGNTQGTAKIYCNGAEASHVYYWENADPENGNSGPADLFTYHRMQEIAFSISSSAAIGPGKIYVIVGGKKSNELDFTVRNGNIYHVKTTGSNSTGDGSWENPWATLGRDTDGAEKKVSIGDIIYAGDGIQEIDTYPESGKTAGFRIRTIAGTEEMPIAIIAYPGANVLAQGINEGIANEVGGYWHFSKLVAKAGKIGSDRGTGIVTFKGGRIIGCEITNRPGECSDGQQGAIKGNAQYYDTIGGAKFFGNYIHDWGCNGTNKLHHTTYISNRSASRREPEKVKAFEFGWNLLLNNKARSGIHVYDENLGGNSNDFCGDFEGIIKIHDNIIVHQTGTGINIATESSTDGPINCFTMPVEIYNNLLIQPGMGPIPAGTTAIDTLAIGISGFGNKSDIRIYNNTIYGYGDNTIPLENRAIGAAISIGANFNGRVWLLNNIIYDTQDMEHFAIIDNTEKLSESKNNIWYNGGNGNPSSPPDWDTPWAGQTSNPQFVNPGENDFRLKSTSPAIDSGVE